jgi:hypothetical protein
MVMQTNHSICANLCGPVGAGLGALQRQPQRLTDSGANSADNSGQPSAVSGEFAESDLFRKQRSDHGFLVQAKAIFLNLAGGHFGQIQIAEERHQVEP